MNLKPNKLTYFTGVAALAALVLFSGCDKKDEADIQMKQMPPQQQAAATTNVESSKAAPNFSLASYKGDDKSLSDYEGKVVMLNFWATWCGPCKREIPDFIELQKKYGSKGFEIVGVALDDPNDVRNFVEASSINYDILFDTQQAAARAYGNIRSIPTTFLINRDGEIVDEVVGMRPKEEWVSKIKSIL